MLKHLFKVLHEDPKLSSEEEQIESLNLILLAEQTREKALDTLVGLFERGPLYDGDVPSKSERDWLLQNDLAAKVVVKGEDGYQALTYRGAWCYRLWKAQKRYEKSIIDQLRAQEGE